MLNFRMSTVCPCILYEGCGCCIACFEEDHDDVCMVCDKSGVVEEYCTRCELDPIVIVGDHIGDPSMGKVTKVYTYCEEHLPSVFQLGNRLQEIILIRGS